LEFCALASGSSGNCIYVGSNTTHVLVDAGISGKRTEEALNGIGIDPMSIKALLVTHDHSDHIMGAAILQKKFNLEVYGTAKTLEVIKRGANGSIDPARFHEIEPGDRFFVGDIKIDVFKISHDALDPVAYTLEADGRKLGMATDLGEYTEHTIDYLKDSDALYIESNYDYNMLMVGRYPFATKKRIDSKLGHLSNDMAAELILRLQNDKLQHIVLAHISKDNNFEELAYETVRAAIETGWESVRLPSLCCAHRYTPTGLMQL